MEARNQPGALRALRTADPAKLLTIASILALISVALALAAYKYPPPSVGLTLSGGIALTGLLALVVARYDWAVALGLVLLGVQTIEPAPADAIFAVVIAVAAMAGRFDVARVPLVVLGSLGALIALNIISAIEAIDPRQAAFFFSITLYLAVFALWLADYVKSEGRARIVVVAYLTGAVGSAALGVFGLILVPGSEQIVYLETRARAFFQDPNVFGPFMVPILLILIEETFRPRLLRLLPPVKLALILLLASGVLLSFSRAAWLNAVLGVVVLFTVTTLRRGGARRLPVLLLVVGAIAVVGSFVVSASGSEDFLEQRTGLQQYDQERFAGQEVGISLAEEHPLGIGPGQFEYSADVAAHSLFVRVFAEQGVLGLASVVALVLGTFVLATRNAVLGRHTFGIGSAALLGAWCGLIVNSFFVDTLHWRHLWLVAALIWAGAMGGDAGEPRRASVREPARPPHRLPPDRPQAFG